MVPSKGRNESKMKKMNRTICLIAFLAVAALCANRNCRDEEEEDEQ